MRPRPHPATAFTLVEILVVMAIAGVLIALTLAGIQASREAARRASCLNHLYQFGRALNGYASVKGQYPKHGYLDSYSFLVEILPQLDRADLYNAINFRVSAYDSTHRLDATHVINPFPSFLCPADRRPIGGPIGWTSYAGNNGTGVQTYGYNGAFVMQSQDSSMATFTDGTTHTAAMSEWTLGPQVSESRDPARVAFFTPRAMLGKNQLDAFRAACRGIDPATARPSGMIKGLDWLIAEFGNTLYNHVLLPNEPTCLNGSAVQQGAWTAGSQHYGGGAHVLFVDGHARRIRQSIAPDVWHAIGSRNGGEPVAGLD